MSNKRKGKSRQDPRPLPAQQPQATTSRIASGLNPESEDAPCQLWCLVEGDSTPFKITSPTNIDIDDLKKLIHEERKQGVLQGVDAVDLVLLKCKNPIAIVPAGTLAERIRSLGELGEPTDKVSAIFPFPRPLKPHLDVFVKKPAASDQSGHAPALSVVSAWPIPEVVFKFSAKNSFGGQPGVELNQISEAVARPNYIREFISQLQGKRKIPTGNYHTDIMKEKLNHAFDVHFEMVSPESIEASGSDMASDLELEHYTYLYGSESEDGSRCLEFLGKEPFAYHWINRPGQYLKTQLVESSVAYRKSWAFSIVGEHTKDGKTEHFKYTPSSDFHLSLYGLPCILLEVISDEARESDRYRMLIQASCVARFANTFTAPDTPPFVVMAIYFNKKSFDRYLVYQPDARSMATMYNLESFSILNPYRGFRFLFELYNYIAAARSHLNNLGDFASRIESLKAKIKDESLGTFYTKPNDKKRSRENDDGDDAQPPSRSRQPRSRQAHDSVFDDPVVRSKLSSAGYYVVEAWVETGIEPLDRISPTVSIATRTDNTCHYHVVLKFIRAASSELSILEYLTAIKSKSNHTVTLLQKIQISSGHIVAFPRLQPLPDCNPEKEEDVTSLARQLVEAVSFMHRNSVAHLDLKPDNILVNVDNPPQCLWITDFSVSVFVSNADEVIEGYIGTPGWTAPEIGDANGPSQKYSPIRADRWSCGRMLQYLMTFGAGFKDPDLERLSRLLLNEDPAKRPDLIDKPLQIKKLAIANPKGHADPRRDNNLRKKRRLSGLRITRSTTRFLRSSAESFQACAQDTLPSDHVAS